MASAGDAMSLASSSAGRPASREGSQVRLELDEASFQLGLDLLIGGIEKRLISEVEEASPQASS
jgi:hypothetical protein